MIPSGSSACLIARNAWIRPGGARRANSARFNWPMPCSAEIERRFRGVIATGFGHLGDGNIHFHVRAGTRSAPDWYESEGQEITHIVDDLVTAAGGSISAEHGIGQLKREELARLAPPGRIHALRAIKHALDPLGIMNPGKLVP